MVSGIDRSGAPAHRAVAKQDSGQELHSRVPAQRLSRECGCMLMLMELSDMVQCYTVTMNHDETDANSILSHDDAPVDNFTRLYEENVTYIYRYINYRVGNTADAEELTSMVFEKALAAFKRYNREKSAPRTWLVSIARNTVTDHFRKSSKARTTQLEEALGVESSDPLPQEQTEKREELKRLRFCFELLTPHEQEIVSLKFGAELKNRRIAVVLDLTENNVGTILYRAVSKLRSCVKDWLNGKG
jgi:RNA polymerase sigma factor (sigma-70 family)